MQEVLTVQETEYLFSESESTLVQTVQESILTVESESDLSYETVITEVLETSSQELLEVALQGPPGPPGSGGGGGGSYEKVKLTDYTVSGFSYVGYDTRICRVDYSTSPPTVKNSATSNLNTFWPNRYSLTYV